MSVIFTQLLERITRGHVLDTLLQYADNCLALRLRSYSEETGVSLEKCVNDALTDWLECVAEPNLEAFRATPRLVLVK